MRAAGANQTSLTVKLFTFEPVTFFTALQLNDSVLMSLEK